MGPPLVNGGNSPGHEDSPLDDYRFNGAAVSERRKFYQVGRNRLSTQSFNGAAVSERRKFYDAEGAAVSRARLQWGRR